MEAKTELPNAKFCLEETGQETKQRITFYCWTKPSEKDSRMIKSVYLQLWGVIAGGSSLRGKASSARTQHMSVESQSIWVEDKDIQV